MASVAYIVFGIQSDATREVPGLWIEQVEGAKHWLRLRNELVARNVQDIWITVDQCVKGCPEDINADFPYAVVQTCARDGRSVPWRSYASIHLVCHSLDRIPWKNRTTVAPSFASSTAPGHQGRSGIA